MSISPVSHSATVTSLSISEDGSKITYATSSRSLRRGFGQSGRAIASFLIGQACTGTASSITVSVMDETRLELTTSGRRFTTALHPNERVVADFLI